MTAILRERASYHDREPPQDAALIRCLKAWRKLSGDRQVLPGGFGAFPFTAVRSWAEVEGLDRESLDLLSDALDYADSERMRLIAAKAALNAPRGKDRS